jgi:hypothetical protein
MVKIGLLIVTSLLLVLDGCQIHVGQLLELSFDLFKLLLDV